MVTSANGGRGAESIRPSRRGHSGFKQRKVPMALQTQAALRSRPDVVRRPRNRRPEPAPFHSDTWVGDTREMFERIGGSPPQQSKTPLALIFMGVAILMAAMILRPAPSRYAIASSDGVLFIVNNRSGFVTPCVVDSDKVRCLGAGHIVDAVTEQAEDPQ